MMNQRDRLCVLAEQIATAFGYTLDYSEASIAQVDAILGQLHDEYLSTQDDDGLLGIALEFGAYLITIIERHYGPVLWKRDHPEVGEESFPVEWNGTTLFPVAWCYKRITDGPGDAIVAKWQTILKFRTAQ